MAFDPSLSTDRDALRFFLGDTDDNAPLFGLDEDGYDAVIARFGMVNAAIMLIDQKIIALGPDKWTDGDVGESIQELYKFWMLKRRDVQTGKLLPSGGVAAPSVATVPLTAPDLEVFKSL